MFIISTRRSGSILGHNNRSNFGAIVAFFHVVFKFSALNYYISLVISSFNENHFIWNIYVSLSNDSDFLFVK